MSLFYMIQSVMVILYTILEPLLSFVETSNADIYLTYPGTSKGYITFYYA